MILLAVSESWLLVADDDLVGVFQVDHMKSRSLIA